MGTDSTKSRQYTVAQQYTDFRCKFPEWDITWRWNGFVAKGDIRPSALSQLYNISITYVQNQHPKVRVLSPQLMPRDENGKIKHTYNDGSLCLYYPKAREWTPARLISDTIVGWASLWLYHYEVWHAIGEWLGGGIEH